MGLDFLAKRIVKTPEVCGGKARIEGHRIRVRDIVKWFEVLNMKADEIAYNYDLSLSDIYLALAYYHANQTELQKEWIKEDAIVKAQQKKLVSKLPKFHNHGKA